MSARSGATQSHASPRGASHHPHDFTAKNSRRIGMRKILLSALAATTLLSAGLLASRAAATTQDSHVRVAAIVCGGAGCNVVQTRGTKQKKLIWLGHG
jgi:hypothetical protein